MTIGSIFNQSPYDVIAFDAANLVVIIPPPMIAFVDPTLFLVLPAGSGAPGDFNIDPTQFVVIA
jgi:hypothetical protein